MSNKIPPHIITEYGSARAFRSEKRKLVKEVQRVFEELRRGCAFFPNGARGIDAIHYEMEILKRELSVKNWGR